MESVNRILDQYVDEYLAETKTPLTKEELYDFVQHLLPIYFDERIVGILGVDIFQSQYLNENVPVLKLLYITPIERKVGSMKGVVKQVMTELKGQGFKRVEIQMNQKLNNWFKREMHSKPYQYAHLQPIDFFLNQLGDTVTEET